MTTELTFPPLPADMEWHNPESYTPEKIGPNHRLLTKAELDEPIEHLEVYLTYSAEWTGAGQKVPSPLWTYRVPRSTPLPDGWILWSGRAVRPNVAKVDVVLRRGSMLVNRQVDRLCWQHFQKENDIIVYRPHVDGGWTLPSPPAGRKWHRNDWTEEMLPPVDEGPPWRPLLEGEAGEGEIFSEGQWRVMGLTQAELPARQYHHHQRTTRPLPTVKETAIHSPQITTQQQNEPENMSAIPTTTTTPTEPSLDFDLPEIGTKWVVRDTDGVARRGVIEANRHGVILKTRKDSILFTYTEWRRGNPVYVPSKRDLRRRAKAEQAKATLNCGFMYGGKLLVTQPSFLRRAVKWTLSRTAWIALGVLFHTPIKWAALSGVSVALYWLAKLTGGQ